MVKCEICDTSLGQESPIEHVSASTSRASTPGPIHESTNRSGSDPLLDLGSNAFVRLSFRRGGEKTFYAALKTALLAKEWDYTRPAIRGQSKTSSGPSATLGIDGILKTIDLDARERDEDLQEALQDLQALMSKAKDMVTIAQSLNAKLEAQEAQSRLTNGSEPSQSDATLIRSSLVTLGLPSGAVTPDMVRDDKMYHQELARELAAILTGSGTNANAKATAVMSVAGGGRGLVSLDEIWCLWNRARGVALVSPRELTVACKYLPEVTQPPLNIRTFKSGLTVLFSPQFSDDTFASRILSLMNSRSMGQTNPTAITALGIMTLDVARFEGLSVFLADEMMTHLEERSGLICRDAGGRDGILWYPNLFERCRWNDPNQ